MENPCKIKEKKTEKEFLELTHDYRPKAIEGLVLCEPSKVKAELSWSGKNSEQSQRATFRLRLSLEICLRWENPAGLTLLLSEGRSNPCHV